MWARLRTNTNIKTDLNEVKDVNQSLNVNEEYKRAIRTKSYGDFFDKAQLLVNNHQQSPSFCHQKFSDILLEPCQEKISQVLESALILSKKSDLKNIIINYFDISAEASKICTNLLRGINQIQDNYAYINKILDTIDEQYFSPQNILAELRSFIIFNNPFSNLNKQDFKNIHDKYSSVLQNLKLKRKKVVRKIKMIKCFNKASGVCVTAACGYVAVAAMVIAAHTLTALIMGPAILGLPVKPLKNKIMNFRFLGSRVLRKVGEQLDVAAKGTYILNRDFDTMSRLVARLHDEIEHNKAMVQSCLDRREDRFSLQVLKELKRNDLGFKKQVEELQEHVYLCLVTINRARVLVIKEIGTPCVTC